MIVDIFSSFDEQQCSSGSSFWWFVWGLGLLIFFCFNFVYWWVPSRLAMFYRFFLSFIYSQRKRTFRYNLGGFSLSLVSLFSLLMVINLLGLVPYIFRLTRHLVISLSLSLPLWWSLILSSVVNNPSQFLAGLLPGGAPAALAPFLVLVERVRIMVRPLTLCLRLTANIGAGHVVITLMGVYLCVEVVIIQNWIALFILLAFQFFYFFFEVGVALVQAYIFSLLFSLYGDEHSR